MNKLVPVFLLSMLVVGCSSQTLGMTSVGVNQKLGTAMVALEFAVENSEDAETVQLWLSQTRHRWLNIPYGDLTEDDQTKWKHVFSGIESMIEMTETPAYIRQRGKSLIALMGSIGKYDSDQKAGDVENMTQ